MTACPPGSSATTYVLDRNESFIDRSTITGSSVLLRAMSLLHTCYRITDIDRSVAFYEALGFEERRRAPIRDEAINVFMSLPDDGPEPRLELTYNFGVDSYDSGPPTATSRSAPRTWTERWHG